MDDLLITLILLTAKAISPEQAVEHVSHYMYESYRRAAYKAITEDAYINMQTGAPPSDDKIMSYEEWYEKVFKNKEEK